MPITWKSFIENLHSIRIKKEQYYAIKQRRVAKDFWGETLFNMTKRVLYLSKTDFEDLEFYIYINKIKFVLYISKTHFENVKKLLRD